ncbi:AraC-type DNA-binding protein [Chitinophaga sp. YR627]|uniref:helix-turn-helix domain-containing protein n=1 Tax=Chitinophaga sp. YR627 TaxID=1881041 RepID=UPI0008E007B9|nr:AraC family transcriptional regulator [Chitinophaga sp. YR627]SFN32090.1 AraC-type DNA-binding protein [Chitinophaga sp. YR627]
MNDMLFEKNAGVMYCNFDIYQAEEALLKERRRSVAQHGHKGIIYELSSPDGINLGYYNVTSSQPGKVVIKNTNPFIQLTYTISGNKSYQVHHGKHRVLPFKKQEYNYLFFSKEQVQLNWQPGERLEIFEVSVSPELMLNYLPQEHPFHALLHRSIERNETTPMSSSNLFLQTESNSILYKMINCPLEGRYKQLYIKSKLGELLSIELDAFEQSQQAHRRKTEKTLRPADIERMHHAREIIISNLQSPCSLIDLAHQVGTNDAYLKRHFKTVFGTTVFGYLHFTKMNQAKELLQSGTSITEVATLTGYKYVSHFNRAFTKHFGIGPGKVRK